ncbi:MAG TPA: TadE/TadG family type IV pilus assembly protein [Stellaceae bacterium]|jgi:Flp pilus assembly protein TadG|nr:TadE/TadG family type IV pilus assembly protein [Stellaceae bacterium]
MSAWMDNVFALRRLWRARDGVAALEAAFLLPTFMLFLLGICEFGRVLWMQSGLQYAVEAAARCSVVYSASTCNGTTATKTYAASQIFGPSIPTSTFSVSGSCTGTMTVTASYAFTFIVPQLFPWNLTLTAKSAYPC